MKSRLTLACLLLIAGAAHAAPISVGGFTFAAGEAAFADDAFLVSGFVGSTCVATGGTAAGSIQEALSGSDVVQCANTPTTEGGVVEVVFTDNFITNGPGTDLVIFELSGPQAPGTPDSRERFGLSIFDGVAFSPFAQFDPIATGFNSGPDPTLDIFAVEIDLTSFGVPPGALVSRLRLHIFNVNLGTKSADIAALGALNSVPPLPECEDPSPQTQGFWRRVCKRDHPDQPDRSILTDELCEDLNPDPHRDPCERGRSQFAALLLNIDSDRVQDSCVATTTGDSVGDLLDAIEVLIADGAKGPCKTAASLAESVNEGGVSEP